MMPVARIQYSISISVEACNIQAASHIYDSRYEPCSAVFKNTDAKGDSRIICHDCQKGIKPPVYEFLWHVDLVFFIAINSAPVQPARGWLAGCEKRNSFDVQALLVGSAPVAPVRVCAATFFPAAFPSRDREAVAR